MNTTNQGITVILLVVLLAILVVILLGACLALRQRIKDQAEEISRLWNYTLDVQKSVEEYDTAKEKQDMIYAMVLDECTSRKIQGDDVIGTVRIKNILANSIAVYETLDELYRKYESHG